MTRLPVLHDRPTTFAQCASLGAPAPIVGRTRAAKAREAVDEDPEDEDPDELDEDLSDELDRRAEESAEQLRADGGMPCPYVGCADHLVWVALGVENPGALTERDLLTVLPWVEQLDVETLPATCARRGPYTLEQIGALMHVTRERIRQIETKALRKIRHPSRTDTLRPYVGEGDGVSRPDLVEKSSTIGLSARAVSAAAARLVPELARDREVASARQKNRGRGDVPCSVEGCANSRSRSPRQVAPEHETLCEPHRAELRSPGRAAKPRRRSTGVGELLPPVTVGSETLSRAQWAKRLGMSRQRLRQLELRACGRGQTLLDVIAERLAGARTAKAPKLSAPSALVTVRGETLTKIEWAARIGMSLEDLAHLARGRAIADVIAEWLPRVAIERAPAPEEPEEPVCEESIAEPALAAVADEPEPVSEPAELDVTAQVVEAAPLLAPAPVQRPAARRTTPPSRRATKRPARLQRASRGGDIIAEIVRNAARGISEIVRSAERGRR